MRGLWSLIAMGTLAWSSAALADAAAGFANDRGQPRAELAPYLQCVPYARERSGVQIYGDARTWWDQAAGRYKRGTRPKPGAVMAFRPSGAMTLGHVAAVARVIDDRTVLLDHANWSPIGGRRGQIERGVRAVDVSAANDWSQVRVWYDPLQALGTTAWPVTGFIYNERESGGRAFDRPLGGLRVLVSTGTTPQARTALSSQPSRKFAAAFAAVGEPSAAPRAAPVRPVTRSTAPAARRSRVAAPVPTDPVAQALARYDR